MIAFALMALAAPFEDVVRPESYQVLRGRQVNGTLASFFEDDSDFFTATRFIITGEQIRRPLIGLRFRPPYSRLKSLKVRAMIRVRTHGQFQHQFSLVIPGSSEEHYSLGHLIDHGWSIIEWTVTGDPQRFVSSDGTLYVKTGLWRHSPVPHFDYLIDWNLVNIVVSGS